jgi:hypothetical protein
MRAYVQPVIGGFLNGVVPGQCKFERDHSERWFVFLYFSFIIIIIHLLTYDWSCSSFSFFFFVIFNLVFELLFCIIKFFELKLASNYIFFFGTVELQDRGLK